MKKIAVCLSLVMLIVSSISCTGNAEEGTIRAVFTTWEPYGYLDNGAPTGFELDIFAAVMENMGRQVEFLNYPWKRCLLMVEDGSADVIISALKTSEREGFMYFPLEPISRSESAFFTMADSDISFSGNYEELKDYTIGVIDGFSYGPDFDAAEYLTKDGAKNAELLVKKLLQGRYELAVGNIAVISSVAEKLGARDEIRFLTPLVHSQALFAGFSKARGHEKLARDFSNALAEFKTTPEYTAILANYGITTPEE